MTTEAGKLMTVGDLIQYVENTYHCMVGPPRAYFELPLAGLNLDARFVYESLVIIAEGTGPETERALVNSMLSHFPMVQSSDFERLHCLFWRRTEKIEISTYEGKMKISTRLVIPGHSFRASAECNPIRLGDFRG